MSVDKPSSNFDLVLQMIPRYFETHNAISAFAGHKMTNSFSSLFIRENLGIKVEILPRKQFLFSRKVLQNKIACISSSTLPLSQYRQVLAEIGVTGLVYRPDSILSCDTALTLNRVSHARCDLFFIFVT